MNMELAYHRLVDEQNGTHLAQYIEKCNELAEIKRQLHTYLAEIDRYGEDGYSHETIDDFKQRIESSETELSNYLESNHTYAFAKDNNAKLYDNARILAHIDGVDVGTC